MQKWMRFSYDHPWPVLALLFILTLLALSQLPKLRQDPSAEGMMISGDRSQEIYQDTLDTFGSDKVTVVFVGDDELFSPRKLEHLDALVYALEELPGVARAESLFSVTLFKNEDGVLYPTPLLDWVPETEEEALQVKEDALAHPMLAGVLVSETGDATAVNLFVNPDASDRDFYLDFARQVERVIGEHRDRFQRIYQVGNPYFRTAVSRQMMQDQVRLVPISMAVLLLSLMVITRSKSGAVLPLLTAGTSILWTLGFMGLVGIPLNVLTVIIPSLIIVIGSTEDIHLLSEYLVGVRLKMGRRPAVHFMISRMGTVITVTALTTFLGFLSICVNRIPILREFGTAAAFGLLVNPLVTALLVPVYLRFFGARKAPAAEDSTGPGGSSWSDAAAGRITRWVTRRRRTVLVLSLGLVGVVALFAPRVRLNNDILGFFKEDSPIIQRVDELSRRLAGVQYFYIRISGGHEGIFKDPENLALLGAVQSFVREDTRFQKVLSLLDVLRMIHRGMEGEDPEPGWVPESAEQVSRYLLLVQSREIEQYVTPDFSGVNLVVRHNLNSSHQQKEALLDLEAFIEETLNPHFTYALTGESILTLEAADAIAEGQAESILLIVSMIFIVMSVLFVNVKAGLLSLVPNVIPIAFNFGVMGLLGIPLNVGTAMVAAIAVGIAVDDTIHFMTRYNHEMHRLKSQEKAIGECIRAEMLPAFSSSVALALGFGVLAFSGFVTIVQFGILSALVMVVAFLSDMLVTPALLSRTRLLTLWDMIGLRLRKEVVERSEFFRDLKPWQMKKIVLLGRIREVEAGSVLFEEWEQGESMFLLLEGEVQVYGVQEETGREVPYNLLMPGDIFGQIALLEPGPRSAHVRARGRATVVEIGREDFDRLQGMYPRIAAKALRNMARILGHQLALSSWRYKEEKRR